MFLVRKCLDILGRDSLGRLASGRNTSTARSLDERRKILARSYHGDWESLLNDLRREDLVAIFEDGITIGGREYDVPGVSRLSVKVLRELAIKVYARNTKPRQLVLRPSDDEYIEEGGTTEVRETRTTRPTSDTSTIRVLSTQHGEAGGKLTFGALQTSLRSARRISLASAFFDDKFIDELFRPLQGAKRRPVVRMLFNGLAGARLKDQLDQLKEIEKKLVNLCKDIQIRLKFETGIFHSKLLIIESSSVVAFVGSANATMAALHRNEELMIRIPDSPALLSYYDTVWEQGEDINEKPEPLPKSLVAFFRTGVLFFRPVIQLQVTFNPFTKLLSLLSDKEKKRIAKRDVPNSEIESGIGVFSTRAALKFPKMLKSDEGVASKKNMPSIAAYSIETCLGYWVPTVLRHEFQEKLKQSAIRKRNYWAKFAEAVAEKSPEFFQNAFNDYRVGIWQIFKEEEIDLGRYLSKLDSNPFEDNRAFERFLKTLKDRLCNDDDTKKNAFIDRLCEPFVEGSMPEIWDDSVTVMEFERSFFEYLEYVVNRPGNGSRVPSCVAKWCRYARGASSKEIRKALKKRLQEQGWHSSNWSLKSPTKAQRV